MYRYLILSVLSLGFLVSPPTLAQSVYIDSDFDVANDWSVIGPFVTPDTAEDGAFSAQQAVDNGNSFMDVGLTRATVSSGEVATWGAVINDTFTWDPSDPNQGAIGNLSVQFDLEGGGAWSMAVRQGEFVWFALFKRVVRNSTDPFLVSIDSLVEEDFVPFPGSEFVYDNQPMHPDFSVDGAPISFGIGVGFSCPTTSNCTTVSPRSMSVDNLRIEVCKVIVINAGMNDAWFNAATAGQGFFFTVFPDLGAMFLAWFTYDTERPGEGIVATLGEPGHRWLTAFGDFAGDSAVLDAELTSGGVFNSAEPMVSQEAGYGTITITFCDCGSATLAYDFPSLGLMGVIPLTRIANDNVAACEALNALALGLN